MKIAFVGTNSDSFFSKAIKWFTKSKWTHAMLVLDDTLDGDAIIVEASGRHGVILNLMSKFQHRPMEIFKDKQDIWDINSIKPYLGDSYGYLQIFGIALVKIFKLKKNPFDSGEVCSELVLNWLLASPYKSQFSGLNKNLASPEDLYQIIKQSADFERVS